MDKEIILIGGTSGVGKTTLAGILGHELKINHRIGTGFVREILRSVSDKTQNPELFNFTFGTENPVENFKKQSRYLFEPIFACIERARNEGTSLIIEGNHLIPSLYSGLDCKHIILSAPDYDSHLARIRGDTHTKRKISELDLEKVRLIDDFILEEARICGSKIIEYGDNLDEITSYIKNA